MKKEALGSCLGNSPAAATTDFLLPYPSPAAEHSCSGMKVSALTPEAPGRVHTGICRISGCMSCPSNGGPVLMPGALGGSAPDPPHPPAQRHHTPNPIPQGKQQRRRTPASAAAATVAPLLCRANWLSGRKAEMTQQRRTTGLRSQQSPEGLESVGELNWPEGPLRVVSI